MPSCPLPMPLQCSAGHQWAARRSSNIPETFRLSCCCALRSSIPGPAAVLSAESIRTLSPSCCRAHQQGRSSQIQCTAYHLLLPCPSDHQWRPGSPGCHPDHHQQRHLAADHQRHRLPDQPPIQLGVNVPATALTSVNLTGSAGVLVSDGFNVAALTLQNQGAATLHAQGLSAQSLTLLNSG